MTEKMFNPSILRWARERCGFSVSEMARRLKVDAKAVRQWELGEVSPTFRLAQDFAKECHLAFGYLLCDAPPELKLPVADFRSGRNALGTNKRK